MDFEKLTGKKEALDRLIANSDQASAVLKNLEDWFRIELTYTSNAIEGNTLTRQETAIVLLEGLTVGGKALREHFEATNHAEALDWVRQRAAKGKASLSEEDLLEIHSKILRNIDDENAGCYRTVAVRIAGSNVILPNPLKVPDLMSDLGSWLRKRKRMHPVAFAAEAHYQLVTIHPFVDGNGRTARLLMNLILLKYGYPPAIIRRRDRLAYLKALEKAQLGGPKDGYLELIAKAVDRSLDIYLKQLQALDADDQTDEDSESLVKIGVFAKEAGETVRTIRYWTELGLLQIADITPTNRVLYSLNMLDRVRRIQELKAKRFTLAQILERLEDQ